MNKITSNKEVYYFLKNVISRQQPNKTNKILSHVIWIVFFFHNGRNSEYDTEF